MASKICKNCELPVSENYCQHCGQRTSVGKITFKETLQDFVDMVFSVNAPLMLTLKMLIVNPGLLFREYLSGKRKKYYKPVSFLILVTIILVLSKSIFGFDPMDGVLKVQVENQKTMNLILSAGVFISKNANNIVFLFVLTLSISLKLFFAKRYLWAEYLAVSFYIIGFYSLVTAFLIPVLKLLMPSMRSLPLIFLVLYTLYAIVSFFKTKNVWTFIKIIFSYVLALITYIILGYGLSFIIVWLKS